MRVPDVFCPPHLLLRIHLLSPSDGTAELPAGSSLPSRLRSRGPADKCIVYKGGDNSLPTLYTSVCTTAVVYEAGEMATQYVVRAEAVEEEAGEQTKSTNP